MANLEQNQALATGQYKDVAGNVGGVGPNLSGAELPALDKLSAPVELCEGLTLSKRSTEVLLSWEHSGPTGAKTKAEFIILPDSKADLHGQVATIIALYNRDYLRSRAGNPVLTAFFRGMLGRADVKLRTLANCSLHLGTIRCCAIPGAATLSNITLDSCVLELEAEKLHLSKIKIEGASSIFLNAKESSLAGVQIAKECVLAGNLGRATITADCSINSRSVDMDFRNAVWGETPKGPSVGTRTIGIIVRRRLVSDEFAKQANLQPLTPELEAESYNGAKDRLNQAWS